MNETDKLIADFIHRGGTITRLPPGEAQGATGYYHTYPAGAYDTSDGSDKPKKPAKRGRTSRFEKHKDEILERIEEGESIAAIARSFNAGSGSLNNLIKRWQKSDD
jgi:hypothetical protein